jgi:polysaccharide biosynthesis transport protein
MDTQFTPDFSDYLAAIKRRHFLLLAIALPIVAIGAALAIGLPSVYVSNSLIEFARATVSGELQNERPDRTYADQQRTFADQYVANIRDSVLTASNLEPVYEKVKGLPEIPSDKADALAAIREHTTIQSVRTKVLDPDTGREREIVPAFSVAYASRDPRTAQAVASALTEAVIDASRQNMLVRARAASQFYEGEAQRYRAQIAKLQGEVADFKAKHIGELPDFMNVNMSQMDRMQQDLESAQLQLQQLNQSRTFLEVQLQQAQTASNLDLTTLQRLEAEYAQKEPIYGENHPDIVSLRRQIQNLRNGGAELEGMSLQQQLAAEQERLRTELQRYSPDYPDVKATKRRIEVLQQRIARGDKALPATADNPTVVQLKTQINSVDNQIAGVQAHQADLRRQIGELQKRLATTPMVGREFDQLSQGLQLAQTKYDDLMKQQMESQLTAQAILDGRSDELRIVNHPGLPEKPAKPKRPAIVVIGLILALVLALSAVIIAESLDQTVRGSRDVRRVLSLSPLAVVPRIQDAFALRRQRLKLAALACSVVVCGVIAVLAVGRFM